MGVQYTICYWAINRTDPQNLLSTTLDVLLHLGCSEVSLCSLGVEIELFPYKLAISNIFLQYSKPLPVPVIINREPEYKISEIVDSKIDCQKACKLLYKVIWLEYEDTNNNSK